MKKTFNRIKKQQEININPDWLQIKTIDMHTGGEPLRVIVDGYPTIVGTSVMEYRQYCREHLDHLRKALMFEPRGHADMYGCLLVPPNDDEADFGIIFMHNEGYSTMCGHAIIAISTLAVQMKWVDVQDGEIELKIDAPCGRITSFVNIKNDRVIGVRFHCVPSFVLGLDREVHVGSLGKVIYDVAYGGAFYAYVDLEKNKLPLDLSQSSYQQLIAAGMRIKHAVMEQDKIAHPMQADLSFLYGTIFLTPSSKSGIDSRNVCIFADGEVDRCPTGSGVSGRMAIHHKRGELSIGEEMKIESITDSIFSGSVVSTLNYCGFDAVIPQVKGDAFITGMHDFIIDPDDPMKEGFLLR